MMRINKQYRTLAGGLLLVALIICCSIGVSSSKRVGYDDSLSPRNMSKRQLVNRVNLLEDAYACIKQTIDRIIEGNIKFPKVCCSLPIFNFICNASKRAQKLAKLAESTSDNEAQEE